MLSRQMCHGESLMWVTYVGKKVKYVRPLKPFAFVCIFLMVLEITKQITLKHATAHITHHVTFFSDSVNEQLS